jgi:hypothetical protein
MLPDKMLFTVELLCYLEQFHVILPNRLFVECYLEPYALQNVCGIFLCYRAMLSYGMLSTMACILVTTWSHINFTEKIVHNNFLAYHGHTYIVIDTKDCSQQLRLTIQLTDDNKVPHYLNTPA